MYDENDKPIEKMKFRLVIGGLTLGTLIPASDIMQGQLDMLEKKGKTTLEIEIQRQVEFP